MINLGDVGIFLSGAAVGVIVIGMIGRLVARESIALLLHTASFMPQIDNLENPEDVEKLKQWAIEMSHTVDHIAEDLDILI